MQGFPAGWFTNVPDVGVNDGLRLAGNSVNPYQAAHALHWCLTALTAQPTDQPTDHREAP